MQNLHIYHNPRCSKSRQTLALLVDRNLQPDIIEYLKTPPSVEQLKQLMDQLGITDPRAMMRKKEAEYIENNLSDPSLTDNQLLKAMEQMPKLLERPIVVNGDKARIGRPPESVLEII
ncbi:arsenate reductase (glutaredoxin) [Aliiglaciecola litoralis]|uniref:Arsenate reductase n=1 Tax=Aliiglaciecola litoralis TaxID=582857 RepID=A0ABP3WPR4_9ALTE